MRNSIRLLSITDSDVGEHLAARTIHGIGEALSERAFRCDFSQKLASYRMVRVKLGAIAEYTVGKLVQVLNALREPWYRVCNLCWRRQEMPIAHQLRRREQVTERET